ARGGLGGDGVVLPAVAVVDGVGGDGQSAAARPQYVPRGKRLAQPGDGVGAVQRADRGSGGGAGGAVVAFAVNGRGDHQGCGRDGAGRRLGADCVVAPRVAVVDRVGGNGQGFAHGGVSGVV